MHWNNVPKFDYTLKKFDGYWNIADIDAFVDSELGNDSTGDGSATNPYKTISKVKSIGATKWAAGKKIMVNGVFDEVLTINVAVRIVGAGGGVGSRALFLGGITASNTQNTYLDNVIVFRTTGSYWVCVAGGVVTYTSNCIFVATNTQVSTDGSYVRLYSYYSIFISHTFTSTDYAYMRNYVYGNNNTFYGCSLVGYKGAEVFQIFGNNNHVNNTICNSAYNFGYKNILNTNGNYLDVTNYNFNFLNTSALYRTGTFNGDAQNYNHVGAGTLGISKVATDDELKPTGSGGDATYTNTEVYSTTKIKRTSTASDGEVESGYIDFGDIQSNVVIGKGSTYEYESGKLLRTIQQTATHTYRNALDYYLKYGNSTDEVDDCDWLLMEWGKEVTVTDVGGTLYGNADANFDPDSYTSPSFQYCKVKFVFKTRTP